MNISTRGVCSFPSCSDSWVVPDSLFLDILDSFLCLGCHVLLVEDLSESGDGSGNGAESSLHKLWLESQR